MVTLFADHLHQSGNLIRTILKISIHGNHHIAGGSFETGLEGCCLAVIAAETYSLHPVVDG